MNATRTRLSAAALALIGALAAGCGSDDTSGREPTTPEEAATQGVKSYITKNLDGLHAAASSICSSAPTPDADGWSAETDGAAVNAMKDAWRKTRTHYERVEGAIAVLFPETDVAIDERYDGFLASGPDDDLFDDQGATGMHAIERILWADAIPENVAAFESELPGYVPAAFPANQAQAESFKNELCARLVADVDGMRVDFGPVALDPATAFRGVIGSMEEQIEKVTLAATAEEESRYSKETLADMRANLEGGKATYEAFREWLRSVGGGADADAAIAAAFGRLDAHYATLEGSSIPPVPATWNPDAPSEADLETEYGKLYSMLQHEVDPDAEGSLVQTLSHAADLLGIPRLPE